MSLHTTEGMSVLTMIDQVTMEMQEMLTKQKQEEVHKHENNNSTNHLNITLT